MSTIKKVKEELLISDKPVMKALHHNKGFKVLVLGLNKGVALKAHTAKWPSRLTVIEGSVNYIHSGNNIRLDKDDEHDIPVLELHEVLANEKSICLLTQSNPDHS